MNEALCTASDEAADKMCIVYDRLGIAWATSLLGFLSLAMLPIPWILFKYGSQIRKKSKFDTIKA